MRKEDIKKVVTFRASSIGDALMGKYFLENAHAYAPEAKCFMFVGSRGTMIRDLFQGYPWLTVIEANRKKPLSVMHAYRALTGSSVTLTQEAERPFSFPSKVFARVITRSGGLYGFDDHWFGNKYLYDHLVPFSGEAQSDGIIREEQKALALMGIPVSVLNFSLAYTKNVSVVSRFGCTEKKYVVMHLFAGSEGREISPEKRLSLVTRMRQVLPKDIHILLTGGKGREKTVTDAIRDAVPGVQSIAGETSMSDLINLIAEAGVVVSLNTGASHIAAHVKTPVVVLAQKGGKHAWWSPAMYGGVPKVFCNEDIDDSVAHGSLNPLSMETIPDADIVSAVSAHFQS